MTETAWMSCCTRMSCLPRTDNAYESSNVVQPMRGLETSELLPPSARAPDPELSLSGLLVSLLLLLTGAFYVAYSRLGLPESCDTSITTYFLWQGVVTLVCGLGMACVYFAGKKLLYVSLRAREGAPTPGKFSIAGSFFGGLLLLLLLQVAILALLVRGILLLNDANASDACGSARMIFFALLALSVLVLCGSVYSNREILRVLSPRHFG
eukprot:TRINITY_DN89347_c0_g1_i1.p1 TRINITY_DN89347_c0_g1~~TRINITY_DN89347_c0_g1_i1.p1  ORF type:complete len:232 (+),score=31.41 TRINITY_DN89347_c0_g1_i1:68-697(+)